MRRSNESSTRLITAADIGQYIGFPIEYRYVQCFLCNRINCICLFFSDRGSLFIPIGTILCIRNGWRNYAHNKYLSNSLCLLPAPFRAASCYSSFFFCLFYFQTYFYDSIPTRPGFVQRTRPPHIHSRPHVFCSRSHRTQTHPIGIAVAACYTNIPYFAMLVGYDLFLYTTEHVSYWTPTTAIHIINVYHSARFARSLSILWFGPLTRSPPLCFARFSFSPGVLSLFGIHGTTALWIFCVWFDRTVPTSWLS